MPSLSVLGCVCVTPVAGGRRGKGALEKRPRDRTVTESLEHTWPLEQAEGSRVLLHLYSPGIWRLPQLSPGTGSAREQDSPLGCVWSGDQGSSVFVPGGSWIILQGAVSAQELVAASPRGGRDRAA